MKYIRIVRIGPKWPEEGSVIEIPETQVEMTLKQHPEWRIETPSDLPPPAAPAKVPPGGSEGQGKLHNPLECPICEFVAKSPAGLAKHKAKH
jgi:hypothetical protein